MAENSGMICTRWSLVLYYFILLLALAHLALYIDTINMYTH